MWEAMLDEVEGDYPWVTARPKPRPTYQEEPDMQEYVRRQLEREGYDARGVRLQNLPKK